jgi:hypothetical protein
MTTTGGTVAAGSAAGPAARRLATRRNFRIERKPGGATTVLVRVPEADDDVIVVVSLNVARIPCDWTECVMNRADTANSAKEIPSQVYSSRTAATMW